MAATSRHEPDMPGLFTPKPSHARSSSRPNLFEPTFRASAVSETTGRLVTASDDHGTRKRSRFGGDFDPPSSTPHTLTTSPWSESLSYSRASLARSPPPLANDRYELAGGMEGPDRLTKQNGDYDDYYHLERQRGMWSTPTSPPAGVPQQVHIDALQSTPNGTKPWMIRQIMGVVGGVAGKLIQFCAVPFRGFQAGGGQAYTFEANTEVAAKLGLQDNQFISHSAGPIHQTLPGHYPEDDYGVLSIESLDNERPRMSKRLRTGENWVVVDRDGEMESRPSTPRLSERKAPNHTRSPSQIPRPVSRASASTPVPQRPSLIPVSRRSTMDRRSFQGAVKVAAKPQGSPRSYSRQSYGSPVMFESKTNKDKSPLPPDSQRLINKMRREELEEDARMRRMSSQMSAMLREAREALGSKFEVEDEYMNEDENDMIEDHHSAQMRLYPR